ncbi:MAG: TolC family protein [Deltaproteobacteria bacterium]|nr:TolC family protein [Deltaproteobacteria bacterium]
MRRSLLTIVCMGVLLLIPHEPCFSADDVKTSGMELSEAIDIAVQNYHSIRAAMENQLASREERKSARADFLPKTSATYSYAGIKEKPFSKMGPTIVQTADRNQFHWDISLIQPLFTGFALSSKYNMTKLHSEIRDEEKRQAVLDVARNVKNAYFNVLLSQKMMAVADDEVAALTAQQGNAQKFFDQGLIPRNDLLRSQVALANALQNREKARADERLTISQLNILLVREIDFPTVIRDIGTLPKDSYELSALIAESMKQRPILHITRLGIETLEKSVALARSAYYPGISLVGRYEENGDKLATSNNDFNNRHNASVLIEAQWTFFEWGKTKADVAKAGHDKSALINRLKEIESGVKLEIKQALLASRVARTNIETAKKAIEQAQENWRITQLQYRQQMVTSSDVLDARSYLTQANSNYYRALYGCLMSLAELDRAVGRI